MVQPDQLRVAVLVALRGRGVQVATIDESEPIDVAEPWPAVNLATAGEVAALGLAHAGALQLGWPVPGPADITTAVAG